MNYYFFSGGVSSVSSQREMTQESHMYSTRVMVDGKIVDVTILTTQFSLVLALLARFTCETCLTGQSWSRDKYRGIVSRLEDLGAHRRMCLDSELYYILSEY